jgi:hypothetical protein
MTRFTKNANGSYNVNGHNYEILSGSRAQVWHGTAFKTSGGLKKSDLMQNKAGRIVSRAKHNTAKKDNRLVKAGYGTKKGTFGFVKLGVTRSKSRGKSRRKSQKGGDASGRLPPLNPAPFAGEGVKTSGAGLQLYATGVGGKRRRKGGTTSRALRGGKQRGGMYALSPASYNGAGVQTSGNAVQFVAGNAN